MDVSAVSAQSYQPTVSSAELSAADSSASGDGVVGLLKDSVEIQGDMALKLIQSGLQTQFTEQKMATAQQIIDTYA